MTVTARCPIPKDQLCPLLARRSIVVLAGRATSVPFTRVLSGPERTTTDNANAAWTCEIHLPHR
jgi:hypothetical protein